jgi:dihydropyrimidine dehydrogenase (NAD+) subunit PreA
VARNPLAIEFAGIPFQNPFLLSSGPTTMDATRIIRAAKLGWGGAVTKTINKDGTVDPRVRLGALRRDGQLIGMNNIELLSRAPLKTWTDDWIPAIKARVPEGFVLVASLMADPAPESWTCLAETLSVTGVDALELNVSCPHGAPEKRVGAFIGQEPDLTAVVTRAAKQGTDLPIFVKLTPNVTDVVPVAKAAMQAGANALSAINTVESLIGVDIETATPLPPAYGMEPGPSQTAFGGLCGPAIRPIGLRIVAKIAQALPQAPISGGGGIENWYNAAEYLMVGARTLQLTTAVMWNGFSIIRNLTRQLTQFMQRKGYESLDALVGAALPKLTTWSALPKLPPVVARIIQDRCKRGKECLVACADAGYQAIRMQGDRLVVDPEKCDGCGLCAVVCKSDAIEFIHSKEARPRKGRATIK